MEQSSTPTFNATTRDANLRRYATMGVGTAVLVGAVTTVDAAVVYTNYNNQVFQDTTTTDTNPSFYDFDFNGDGINDMRLFTRNADTSATTNYAVITAGVTGSSVSPLNVVGTTVSSFNYPGRLGAGVSIGATQNFVTLSLTSSGYLQGGSLANGNGFTNSKWKTAGANSGYLGVSFTYDGALHYGFIGLTVDPQGSGTLSRAVSIGGIGYESTANTAITTFGSVGSFAAVPEPSSLALLAAGGLGGVAAFRRRRKQNAAKAQAAE